jgi:hypothetical protein
MNNHSVAHFSPEKLLSQAGRFLPRVASPRSSRLPPQRCAQAGARSDSFLDTHRAVKQFPACYWGMLAVRNIVRVGRHQCLPLEILEEAG